MGHPLAPMQSSEGKECVIVETKTVKIQILRNRFISIWIDISVYNEKGAGTVFLKREILNDDPDFFLSQISADFTNLKLFTIENAFLF